MATAFDIRSIRTELGVKQKEFATRLGISLRELMLIERGLATCTDEVVKRLAALSSLNPEQLQASLVQSEPLCGEGYVTARPDGGARILRRREHDATKRSVVDLFCGVGGFSFGFEETGHFQVVAGVDLLGDRLSTFTTNHPTANAYGQDIRTTSTDVLRDENPRPFVVVGGPPCQGFSSLRPFRNVEWHDPRNNLGEEFVRIVRALEPEWIVFENVVGLLTHSGGKTWRALIQSFAEIGYRTDSRVINGASFGLPQKRERAIMVGSRSGKRFAWPSPTHHFSGRSMAPESLLLRAPSQTNDNVQDAVGVLDAIDDLPQLMSGESARAYVEPPRTEFQMAMRRGSTALSLHESTRHSDKMMEIIRHSGANISALPPGLVSSGFSSCYSRLDAREPSTTITVNFVHPASNRCIHPTQDRALTPREGARLQSFPDRFAFQGTRTQVVKQIGNAVPPLLGRIIAQAMLESD